MPQPSPGKTNLPPRKPTTLAKQEHRSEQGRIWLPDILPSEFGEQRGWRRWQMVAHFSPEPATLLSCPPPPQFTEGLAICLPLALVREAAPSPDSSTQPSCLPFSCRGTRTLWIAPSGSPPCHRAGRPPTGSTKLQATRQSFLGPGSA